jgi:serine/threonine protein kinase
MGFFTKASEIKKNYTWNEKKDQLGSGNFATVYKAELKVARESPAGAMNPGMYAIKVIDKAKVEDLQDIEREIEIMQACTHPNIIKLYEVYEEKKRINLVMEIVSGGELFDEIVMREKYTEKDAAKVMRTMCDALSYIHKKNIVHRDLKPENVLLAQKPRPGFEPEIKIADFGLARFVAKDDMMKTACGTPGYVAPEVLKNKGYDSGAVDMWSAGVILYILLCGFPPFYDEELPVLFDTIIKGKFDFPSPWWDSISSEGKALVCRLLTVDPKKRITAEQVLQDPWVLGSAPDLDLGNMRQEYAPGRRPHPTLYPLTAPFLLVRLPLHCSRDVCALRCPGCKSSRAQRSSSVRPRRLWRCSSWVRSSRRRRE